MFKHRQCLIQLDISILAFPLKRIMELVAFFEGINILQTQDYIPRSIVKLQKSNETHEQKLPVNVKSAGQESEGCAATNPCGLCFFI